MPAEFTSTSTAPNALEAAVDHPTRGAGLQKVDAELLDPGAGRLHQGPGLAAVVEHRGHVDVGAGGGERDREGLAQPGVPAGDHGRPAGQREVVEREVGDSHAGSLAVDGAVGGAT